MICTPARDKGPARLIAVWPPNWTMTPSGISFSMTFITSSIVSGSKYSRSEVSKSVDTVSGLLLMMIDSIPISRSAQTEWTEQ